MSPHYDIIRGKMVGLPPPETPSINVLVEELRNLTQAILSAEGREAKAAVVNVDVPPAQIINNDEKGVAPELIDELRAIRRVLGEALNRQVPAPIVQVENSPPNISIPEIKIPTINIPEIVMPKPVTKWTFDHKYTIEGVTRVLSKTIATAG